MALVSGHFVDWLGAKLGLQPIVVVLWRILQWPTAVFFVIFSYSLIYYFGPHLEERHWRWISPGAAFGGFVWLLASLGFRLYLNLFDSYSALYGSLGAVMILLAWLYVTALAFLIGGEINAEIRALRRCRPSVVAARVGIADGPGSQEASHLRKAACWTSLLLGCILMHIVKGAHT